jgi:hypothetical protein
MTRHLPRLLLAAAGICLAVVLERSLVADDPTLSLEPTEGLLVLKNGQTLEGQIAQSGDRYIIWMNGSEIRLAADQVDLWCRSIDEAYEAKCKRLPASGIAERVELVRWCLKQNLLDEATDQLEAARASKPDAVEWTLLERQVELARSGPEDGSALTVPTLAGPSGDELDDILRRLPRNTVADYVSTIQPLVLHHCGNGGCHGSPTAQHWPLLRIPSGSTPRRRVTQRNLYNTLVQIDQNRPEMSVLLRMASRAHGGRDVAPLGGPGTPEYQQLVDWVRGAAAGRLPVRPASAQAVLPDSTPNSPQPVASLPPSEPLPSTSGTAANDPFDPEAFNRLHSPRNRDSARRERLPDALPASGG